MKLDKILLTLCVAAGLGYAKSECDDKVFSSLSASKGTTVASMIDQLSAKCSFSVVIKDEKAEEILSKHLNTVNLRDFTLKEILDFLLTENRLDYEYKNGILKIGYYVTKTFKVDLPQELALEALKCQTDEEARQLGVEWCINQCRELIAHGVPSIHFYTVGATESVRRVAKEIY